MAKNKGNRGVYRVTDIIGTSKVSWEDAARSAVETAAKSLRDLRVAAVVGAANNQLASRDVAALLQERGIVWAPDFVVNAGGVIYLDVASEPASR